MTTETQKSELLEDFQRYLQQSHIEPLANTEQPDLNTLLSEMVSLKTEVKTESRQFKNTLDTLSEVLDNVQEDNKNLSAELSANTERLEQQKDAIVKKMLLEVVDIYERLSISLDILQNYRPVKSLFKNSRTKDINFIKQFKEGQAMSLRRFEQLLQQYKVRSIDCVGKLLDPVSMSAVETGNNPKLENGIVLEELRKGFLFKEQILRLAEVKVNKTS
jgi:molecular chaperone GrpE